VPQRLDLALIQRRFDDAFGAAPVTRSTALHVLTRSELRAAVRSGVIVSERHGVVRLAGDHGVESDARGGTSYTEIRRRALAALATVDDRCVISGPAASILRGQPIPGASIPVITATRAGAVNFDGPDLRLRGSALPPHHRDIVDGVPVTSLERTAIDVARGQLLPSALLVLDAAARQIVARESSARGEALRYIVLDPRFIESSIGRLERTLRELFGWPGTVAVREALPLVRPSSESPAESISRGWFLEASLGHLGPGTPVIVGSRTYWADFCDERRRIIGEVDGWAKYGNDADSIRAALTSERSRQRALESDDWRLVRWTITEGRAAVVSRMSRALGRM
jgi:hypothetical protein